MRFAFQTVAPVLAIATALCVLPSQAYGQEPDPPKDLAYTIKAVPKPDQTDLIVTLKFDAKPGQAVKVRLPRDLYGTPNLHKYVTSFEGVDGTDVSAGNADTERMVAANAKGRSTLRYTLSYDPKVMQDVSFGPNIGNKYFHLAGCQWMLSIGNPEKQSRVNIRFDKGLKGWSFYTSLTQDASKIDLSRSYDDLTTTMIGGCEGAPKRFKVRGKPVILTVQGDFQASKPKIEELVQKIVERQRDWFKDYRQDFYLISVLPRPDNIAGTCVENAFVCFIKPTATIEDFTLLIAHELTHNWIGQKLRIRTPSNKNNFLTYQWFSEGVNDYLARRVMLEAGLISLDRYAELFNGDIMNIADNPNSRSTIEDAKKAADEGRFNTAFTKLAYYRGDLIGLNWEAKIGKDGVRKFILELLRKVDEAGSPLPQEDFFEIGKRSGLDIQADLERHILKGELITLDSRAIPGYTLVDTSVPTFDPGFSLSKTYETNLISGVVMGGPAHKAGLRDGMEFVSAENTNRFGNAWRRDKPLVVNVKVEGQEKRFEITPFGPDRILKLFRKL